MATLFRYQPVITPGPNGTDYQPLSEDLTFLCELDGFRYVSIPEGSIPEVPAELSTWEQITLTPELRESIKTASHLCGLYRERFVQTIRTKYSLDDELYFARIATGTLIGSYVFQPGEAELLAAYQADVEAAREVLHLHYTELCL